MATDRKFYMFRYLAEVLSEEPAPTEAESLSLLDLHELTHHGDCSGQLLFLGQQTLNGPQAAAALKRQGSDPEFFSIDENGNDVGDTDDLPPATGEHKVFLIFGSEDLIKANGESCIETYAFDSEKELAAFMRAMHALSEHTDIFEFDTREEAVAYVAQVVLEAADADEDEDEDEGNNKEPGEWAFTAKNTVGCYETFDGYDTSAEAQAAIGRLREKGYSEFSAPEFIPCAEDEEYDEFEDIE